MVGCSDNPCILHILFRKIFKFSNNSQSLNLIVFKRFIEIPFWRADEHKFGIAFSDAENNLFTKALFPKIHKRAERELKESWKRAEREPKESRKRAQKRAEREPQESRAPPEQSQAVPANHLRVMDSDAQSGSPLAMILRPIDLLIWNPSRHKWQEFVRYCWTVRFLKFLSDRNTFTLVPRTRFLKSNY